MAEVLALGAAGKFKRQEMAEVDEIKDEGHIMHGSGMVSNVY